MIRMNINTIEQRLLTLEGGMFQKLCVELFKKKHPDYLVQANGGLLGSNKPTKGHPDFLLKKKDSPSFILVECTTQSKNLKKKIKSDVEACIDENKAGIDIGMIEEIAFCHMGRIIDNSIYSKMVKKLNDLGINFNAYGLEDIASDIYNRFQSLASDFLGIPVPFSKCVFEIDEFINETKKSLSPSLDKKFDFRESEIKLIEDSFKHNQFVVLTGSAGVGKTMLALEYAKTKAKNGEKWLVIKTVGNPNLEEIRESTVGCCHFIVDDLSSFRKSVPDVVQILKGKNAIVTSRNYLMNDLEGELRSAELLYEKLEIDILSDENIESIVKSNLGIANVVYLRKIAEVAKGNPRIAFMAAEGSIKNGPSTLFNVTKVFANYYCDRIKRIKEWNDKSDELLKVIGIVCLLKKLSIEDLKDEDPILKFTNVSKEDFKKAINYLYDNDIVSLFKDDVVEISDQCLADYLSYYVFLEKRLLSLSSFMDVFTEKYYDNVVEMINMFGNMFNSKEGMDYITEEVKRSWNGLTKKGNVKNLKLFCAKFALANESNSLKFLRDHADEKEDPWLGVTNGNVDWRLSAISSLLNVKPNTCCQIIEKMICSKSIDSQSIADILVQRNGISKESWYHKYNAQISTLSYFLNKKEECSIEFLKKYCLEMLKFDISYVESVGNRPNYNIMTVRPGDDNLSALRKKCFDVLFECSDVYGSLDSYFSWSPNIENAGIFEQDLKTIEAKLQEKSDRDMNHELAIYLNLKNTLDFFKLRWEFMEESLKDKLNLILPIIEKSNYRFKGDYYEKERKRDELVLEETKKSSFDTNFKRLELFNEIIKFSSSFNESIIKFVKMWFSTFPEKEMYNKIDSFLAFTNATDKVVGYNYLLIDRIIEEVGANDAFSKIINGTRCGFKEKFITYFFEKAFEFDRPSAMTIFDRYLEDIKVALPKDFDISYFLHGKIPFDKIHLFLKKYFEISEQPENGQYQSVFCSLIDENKGMFNYLLSEDISLLEKLYCLSLKNGNYSFDYEGNYLKLIVDRDIKFSAVVLGLLLCGQLSYESAERMKSIWKCNEYISIGNLMLDFMRFRMTLNHFNDETLMFGFYSAQGGMELTAEQSTWLSSYLNSHKDNDSIKCLNNLVRGLGHGTKIEYAKQLISIGVSKDLFKDFLEFPSIEVLNDGAVSVLNSKISYCESLLQIIPDDISFVDHRQLVEDKISELKEGIESMTKFEKMNS